MNETLNISQYLFLKQNLVILEAGFLKAVVSVDDLQLGTADLSNSIRTVVRDIEINITPPVALLELRKVNIDIKALDKSIRAFIKTAIGDHEYTTASQEKLAELINKYPLTGTAVAQAEELDTRYDYERGDVLDLMNTVQKLIETVYDWPVDRIDGDGLPLREILMCVNFIQMVDELFEYTNEKFGA